MPRPPEGAGGIPGRSREQQDDSNGIGASRGVREFPRGDSTESDDNEEDPAGEEEPRVDVAIKTRKMTATEKVRANAGDNSPAVDPPADNDYKVEVGDEVEGASNESTDKSADVSDQEENKAKMTKEVRRERLVWRCSYYLGVCCRRERGEIDDKTYWLYGADSNCSLFDELS